MLFKGASDGARFSSHKPKQSIPETLVHQVTHLADSQRLFVKLLLVLGIAAMAFFTVEDYLSGEFIQALFQLIATVVLVANLILILWQIDTRLFDAVSLMLVSLVVAFSALNGGDNGSQLAWVYLLPHMVIFLLGLRVGGVLISLIFSVMLVAMLSKPDWAFHYSSAVIVRFCAIFSIMVIQAMFMQMALARYQISMALEHEKLSQAKQQIEQLSITDPLTGLYNRGYLDANLPSECERAQRQYRPLSLALCDLDNFKQINDQYGHQVGDRVLQAVADQLKRSLRSNVDWVARYGGEELVIVMPGTERAMAKNIIERLRREIEQIVVEIDGHQVSISASFGLSMLSAASRITNNQLLLKEADDCLYQAKQAGKNCIRWSSTVPVIDSAQPA